MRSSFRVASLALAATLIVAACGSEESGSGAGAPTDTIAAPDATVVESVRTPPRRRASRRRPSPSRQPRTSRPTPLPPRLRS